MKKKRYSLLLLLLCSTIVGMAQQHTTEATLGAVLEQKKNTANAAADQKINFKSIVTDLIGGRYYQAMLKNGIANQKGGELQIKSTIYGLIRLFDSTRSEQHYFNKLRWARNIQIGSGTTFGNDNQLTSAKLSLTVAIINKREYNAKPGQPNVFELHGLSPDDSAGLKSFVKLNQDLVDKRIEVLVNAAPDDAARKAVMDKFQKIFDTFNSNADFSVFKDLLSQNEMEQLNSSWKKLTEKYDSIQRMLSGGALLTFTSDGNYNGKQWEKLDNKLEFLIGLGSKKDSVRNYDFYAGAYTHFNQDTLNKQSSLNRQEYSTKVGINKVVWKDKADGSSILEAFGGAEYAYIGRGLYAGEKNNAFKLDVNLSIRIAKNLYLPFQVKYNPDSGKFEGYLDLKFDVVNIFR
ncbi:MAG TPA: hypothetical protein VM802_15965 [Chitinophaga sp.]|uniref:hypothetical protein n=1 Tax=Chitinophaga sp. TaxID=1869181 RepID=UPI002BE084C7|nr:hypothetical protein [Chitinophaga sp.]HVI46371.1 hypothetical protein [Chitinophaga sp.]